MKNEKRENRTPTNACSSFGSTNDANKGTTCSSHKCGNKEASQDFMTISDNVVFPLLQKKSKESRRNENNNNNNNKPKQKQKSVNKKDGKQHLNQQHQINSINLTHPELRVSNTKDVLERLSTWSSVKLTSTNNRPNSLWTSLAWCCMMYCCMPSIKNRMNCNDSPVHIETTKFRKQQRNQTQRPCAHLLDDLSEVESTNEFKKPVRVRPTSLLGL